MTRAQPRKPDAATVDPVIAPAASTPSMPPRPPAPAERERWITLARARPAARAAYRGPWHVLMAESVDVVRVARARWRPVLDADERAVLPGLASVGDARLPLAALDDIMSLRAVADTLQFESLLSVSSRRGAEDPDRARFVVGELKAALAFCLDGDDDGAQQLAQVNAHHADDPRTHDALASALDDYARLAAVHRDALAGIGGFDPALVAEAAALAHRLRRRPTPAERANEGAEAADLRDRVAAMLVERIQRVRAAARYVFRHHPEVAREFGSDHDRARRAKQRAKKTPPTP